MDIQRQNDKICLDISNFDDYEVEIIIEELRSIINEIKKYRIWKGDKNGKE